MPISAEAYSGLKAAAEWNPNGAQALLAILREYPSWVKYKEDDLYGPLSLVLFGVMLRKQLGSGTSIPIESEPLSEDNLAACRTFGDEWKQRRFTKKELADFLEEILVEMGR